MDDDFDFDDPENQLEDNFIELANAAGSDEYDAEYENSDNDSNFADEERDEVGSLNGSFNEEETKSRFTEYSMTSSVIRRNEQLTLLDGRFEKVNENKCLFFYLIVLFSCMQGMMKMKLVL